MLNALNKSKYMMSEFHLSHVSLYHVWDTMLEQKLNNNLTKEVPDDVLLALHSLHGSVLERAIEIIDKGCLTIYRTKGSSREVLQVVGSSGMIYTLFHNINFCQCQAYKYQVLVNKTNITCKHVLAAALSYATNNYKVIEVASDDLTKLLVDSFVGKDDKQTSGFS